MVNAIGLNLAEQGGETRPVTKIVTQMRHARNLERVAADAVEGLFGMVDTKMFDQVTTDKTRGACD